MSLLAPLSDMRSKMERTYVCCHFLNGLIGFSPCEHTLKSVLIGQLAVEGWTRVWPRKATLRGSGPGPHLPGRYQRLCRRELLSGPHFSKCAL